MKAYNYRQSSIFYVSGIFISPQKGRYYYAGRVVKCCLQPSSEIIFPSSIGKMPILADFFTICIDKGLLFLYPSLLCRFSIHDTATNLAVIIIFLPWQVIVTAATCTTTTITSKSSEVCQCSIATGSNKVIA